MGGGDSRVVGIGELGYCFGEDPLMRQNLVYFLQLWGDTPYGAFLDLSELAHQLAFDRIRYTITFEPQSSVGCDDSACHGGRGVFNRARIKVGSCFICHWQLPSGLLIDVTRWQSPCSNALVENFLLQRKGDPFLRRIGIGPQTAKLQKNFLFALCHSLALE